MKTLAKKKRPRKPTAPPPLTPGQIHAIRTGLGLTQAEAAEKVGVARRTWAAWEGGEFVPTPPLLILIRLLAQKKI